MTTITYVPIARVHAFVATDGSRMEYNTLPTLAAVCELFNYIWELDVNAPPDSAKGAFVTAQLFGVTVRGEGDPVVVESPSSAPGDGAAGEASASSPTVTQTDL